MKITVINIPRAIDPMEIQKQAVLDVQHPCRSSTLLYFGLLRNENIFLPNDFFPARKGLSF
jgi:hypothetical protein